MRLPIGYDDFAEVIETGLNYVDKTLFIKEILEDIDTKAIVITRPRRFGKTLNLSMLHYFLASEVRGKSTQGLFNGLEIFKCSDTYSHYQGKYPVVSITFKDVKESNYESAYENLSKLMSGVYSGHLELLESPKLASHQKKVLESILEERATEQSIKSSLFELTKFIYLHHDMKPWLLLDEYDTPIQAAYVGGYYEEMMMLMRGMMGAALKNNPYLHKAVITGILRVAKESLFSGVNNLRVYSILNTKYSEYFGFTESEVDHILREAHLLEKAADIKAWYNGYQVGQTTIYNPWSIVNCIQEEGHLKPYWVNTSDNQLMKDLIKKSPLCFKKDFEALLEGTGVEKLIDEHMAFQYLNNHPESTWSLLLMAGYLKSASSRDTDQGVFAQLAIPNREVRNLYRQIIEQWLSNGYGIEWYNVFIRSLLEGNMDEFKAHLEKVLLQIVSCHDVAKEPEAFYHGLLLGFMVSLNPTYDITSNRESGRGRFDILMIPKEPSKLAIVMELKVKGEHETLEQCAAKALQQIEDKKYTATCAQRGVERVIHIGIGFKGKEFALAYVLP